VELLRHPLFKHVAEQPRESILDCLSPLGRRRMPRVEITTETDTQAPPPSDGFRTSESTSAPVQTIENSRTLVIVNTNLRYGFNAKPAPIKRYRMIQVSTYLSTCGGDHVRTSSSDDSED
jgi:hypothetical protein